MFELAASIATLADVIVKLAKFANDLKGSTEQLKRYIIILESIKRVSRPRLFLHHQKTKQTLTSSDVWRDEFAYGTKGHRRQGKTRPNIFDSDRRQKS
jgi:hypothetical protein